MSDMKDEMAVIKKENQQLKAASMSMSSACQDNLTLFNSNLSQKHYPIKRKCSENNDTEVPPLNKKYRKK
jgi:hypothetical protein